MSQAGPPGLARPRPRHFVRPSRALGFALVNVAAGFIAVALGTIMGRADWAALLTTLCVPPLLLVTLFHAMRDIGRGAPGADARVQAWLALLLSVAPALLLGIFFVAAGPAAHGQPVRWLPWTKE